ncbi:DUF2563 family protein [Nocardia callitridis]|uniref:Uncharacterized protein n=1 Tax=Nocardia callitridis TaxID=648753 RepID=A0ABP9KYW0_9NOCA
MDADLDRILRGSNHAETAAGHVHDARGRLGSIELAADMFGLTAGATSAHGIMSRAHERYARELDGHHRSVTWIRENTSGTAVGLDLGDVDGAASVRRTQPPM